MDGRPVLLINTNVVQPPVSPVGLEYVGEALVEAKVPVRVLDLTFEPDWKAALVRELKDNEPLLVGLAVRNTDDCCYATRQSFLPWVNEVVAEVRRLTSAFVLLGGVGFSVMPEAVLRFTGADAGIAGDGEEVAVALTRCLMSGDTISHLPSIIYRYKGAVVRNPRANTDLKQLPVPRRRLIDNKRYEQLGAMVGIETKRGCPNKCIFCADPVAKGSMSRLRSPSTVVQEFQDLLAQGISWFHLGDSEFNLPLGHAKSVCQAVIEAGLGDKLRWYTYCAPTPFDQELASLMKLAGCAGINFGVDSLCNEQLLRLGQSHSVADVHQLVQILKQEGFNFMFDLMVGGPGETEETVKATVQKVKELDITLAGISAGVRVYQGTSLGKDIVNGAISDGLYPRTGHTPGEPLFYLSPSLGRDASPLISELVAGDPRFLVLATPAEEGSYNYAGDDMLSDLIRKGARGAYWDILRQSRG